MAGGEETSRESSMKVVDKLVAQFNILTKEVSVKKTWGGVDKIGCNISIQIQLTTYLSALAALGRLKRLSHCKKNCCSFVDMTQTVADSVVKRQTFLSMQQHLSAHFSPAGR